MLGGALQQPLDSADVVVGILLEASSGATPQSQGLTQEEDAPSLGVEERDLRRRRADVESERERAPHADRPRERDEAPARLQEAKSDDVRAAQDRARTRTRATA